MPGSTRLLAVTSNIVSGRSKSSPTRRSVLSFNRTLEPRDRSKARAARAFIGLFPPINGRALVAAGAAIGRRPKLIGGVYVRRLTRPAPVAAGLELGRSDRASLYDESLPPGLILRMGQDEAGEHAGQER
jgi:hypothetical protein